MSRERRSHIRVAFSIRASFHCPAGFIYNVPVLDISQGGLRLEIPIEEEFLNCQEGTLKLLLTPSFLPDVTPYQLEIPCKLVWYNHRGVGIEFLHTDRQTMENVNDLIREGMLRDRFSPSPALHAAC